MTEKKKKQSKPHYNDRRDSPRTAMRFLVRDAASKDAEWVEREGDLSLGGIYWRGLTPPQGKSIEVRFRLKGVSKEIRGVGEVIRLLDHGSKVDFHLRFTELDVQSELAIARYLDEAMKSAR